MSTVVACDNFGEKNRVPAAAHGVPHCSNCRAPLAWIADVGDDEFDDAWPGDCPCSSTCGPSGAGRAAW